jgi:C1A family cysteine protease
MTRKFGRIKDRDDHRDHILAIGKRDGVSYEDVDLRTTGFMPAIWDQGDTSSCTAHGIGAAYEFMRAKENILYFQPSRLFIYYNERALENSISDPDAGAEIRDGLVSLIKWGAPHEDMWPFDLKKVVNVPTSKAYGDAWHYKIKAYKRLPFMLRSIQSALTNNIPIIFGCEVYDSFMDIGSDGVVPENSGNLAGGHCMLIVGSKPGYFIVRNSWGTSWGDNGYCYMPYSVLMNDRTADFWAITTA